MKILVTGTAGFIGYHTVHRLLSRGDEVVGIDSINDYYDPNLKYSRLAETGIMRESVEYGRPVRSKKYGNYTFIKLDLKDGESVKRLMAGEGFNRICHLAAQAGVRYSLENPFAYIDSNVTGFMNILESCRESVPEHLVFASSSSVYGLNEKMPFATSDNVDHPVSLYAATKKSNELMAHVYSHLFSIPVTGLRFFTVYGPWGRPDMAYYKFTKSIIEGKTIDVYNNGDLMRDFTYIDDIVSGVVRVIDRVPAGNPDWSGIKPDPGNSRAPYKIYNIGNHSPVKLLDFIGVIEGELGITADKRFLPMQPGDVYATYADTRDLERDTGFSPSTPIGEGMKKFITWYKEYYAV